LLEQRYACQPALAVRPTNASASLGAVAAGLAASELEKLLASDDAHVLLGRSVMHDLRHHRQLVTRYERNPGCRFDHQLWEIEALDCSLTELSLAGLVTGCGGGDEDATVELYGRDFIAALYCPQCHVHGRRRWRVAGRPAPDRRLCRACRQPLVARGFDMRGQLVLSQLSLRDRARSLRSFGFRDGDVVTVSGPNGVRHLLLSASRPQRTAWDNTRGNSRTGVSA
jgi:hypothetical protein